MIEGYEDVSEVFLDLIFKVSLLQSQEGLKEAILKCLKNSIADVNRNRIQTSLSSFTEILQEVLSSFTAQVNTISDDSGSLNLSQKQDSTCLLLKCNESETTSSLHTPNDAVDSRFVQITADSDEVNRRISAFIERQRVRVNFANIQEFCGVQHNADDSCARVDAVFVPRTGSKSHILVRKVVNHCGPQTRDPTRKFGDYSCMNVPPSTGRSCQLEESASSNCGLEERLNNMETHLKLYSSGPVPKDVFQRLQELENRLLYLESISPEYFDQFPIVKRRRLSSSHLAMPDSRFRAHTRT